MQNSSRKIFAGYNFFHYFLKKLYAKTKLLFAYENAEKNFFFM